MNSVVLEKIVEQLSGLIEATGFAAVGEGEYKNDKLAFKISHNEEQKQLLLEIAELTADGEIGEYSTASAWLFENPEELRDAESAGLDFLDTLKGRVGYRNARTDKNGGIAMPSKESAGAPNIEVLCAKTLAVYPQYKDYYKEHITTYGSLLYVEFFKNTLVVKVGELLDENNKKNIKKVFSMLSELYVEGDRTVQNVIVGIVLCGAVKEDANRYDTALENMEDFKYLKTAFINILQRYKKDKKLREMLA